MISREKYLLTCLAEEAVEVAQRATKAIRFGLNEKQPGQDKTNIERLCDEIIDLSALCVMCNIPIPTRQDMAEAVQTKIEKVGKYLAYSVDLGEAQP